MCFLCRRLVRFYGVWLVNNVFTRNDSTRKNAKTTAEKREERGVRPTVRLSCSFPSPWYPFQTHPASFARPSIGRGQAFRALCTRVHTCADRASFCCIKARCISPVASRQPSRFSFRLSVSFRHPNPTPFSIALSLRSVLRSPSESDAFALCFYFTVD